MFTSWKEYRDYLTDKLIKSEEHKKVFKKEWEKMDTQYSELRNPDELIRKQIRSVLVNDNEFAKLASYLQSPAMITYRKWKRGELLDRARDPKNLVQIKKQYLVELYGQSN